MANAAVTSTHKESSSRPNLRAAKRTQRLSVPVLIMWSAEHPDGGRPDVAVAELEGGVLDVVRRARAGERHQVEPLDQLGLAGQPLVAATLVGHLLRLGHRGLVAL